MEEWKKRCRRSTIQDGNELTQPETKRMRKATDPRRSRNVIQRYKEVIRVRPTPKTKKMKRRAQVSTTNKERRAINKESKGPNKK